MKRLLGVVVVALLAGCTTTVQNVGLTGCTVAISHYGPMAQTVAVHTARGARVALAVNYAQLSAQELASGGTATFHLPNADAPVGVATPVIATATLGGVTKTCSASFTPA